MIEFDLPLPKVLDLLCRRRDLSLYYEYSKTCLQRTPAGPKVLFRSRQVSTLDFLLRVARYDLNQGKAYIYFCTQ